MRAAGAYGKMPSAGDFIRLRIPRSFVETWDAWIQQWLAPVRAGMGARWSDAYLTAPVWRFTLGPSIAGGPAWLGVMAASVDRVGRQFPLTLAAPLVDGAEPALVHLCNDILFEALEGIALRVLEEDVAPSRLEELLDGAPAISIPSGGASGGRSWIAADRTSLRAALAAGALDMGPRTCVWSSDDGRNARMFASSGLPLADQAAGFVDLVHPMWHPAGSSAA